MIWNDTHLNKKACPSLPVFYLGVGVLSVLAYLTFKDAIFNLNVKDKIFSAGASICFIYFDIFSALIILKGNNYVKTIIEKDGYFILINIFNKQFKFTISDVLSVKTSKFSIINKFLTGFAKHIPGVDLILKNGSQFYITSDMQDIDILKEHLLGLVNGQTRPVKIIWNDTQINKKPPARKSHFYASLAFTLPIICFAIISTIIKPELSEKTAYLIAALFFIYLSLSNIYILRHGNGYIRTITKEEDQFILINFFYKSKQITISDVLQFEPSELSGKEKLFTGFSEYSGHELSLKDGSKYFITANMENIETLKAQLLA